MQAGERGVEEPFRIRRRFQAAIEQELGDDRRRAQLPRQVLDRGRVRQAGVGASEVGRYVGMARGETLDVNFVNDRLGKRRDLPGGVVLQRIQMCVAQTRL